MVYLLIITPETANSNAAMSAEVPTDRPRARWDNDGWAGNIDTATQTHSNKHTLHMSKAELSRAFHI